MEGVYKIIGGGAPALVLGESVLRGVFQNV